MIQNIKAATSYAGGVVSKCTRRKYVTSGWIAHHGLQRNGTNFLLVSLKKLNIDIINEFDPARNNPKHKHFRWYSEKSKIPGFIRAQYDNTLTAQSVADINRICGYPDDTRHIVIRKKQDDAVVSLANWGLRFDWFDSKDEALASSSHILQDYQEYYAFWEMIASKDPDKAVIINLEDLLGDSTTLLSALRSLGCPDIPASVSLDFDEIPQSPKSRRNPITKSDYASFVQSN